MPASLTPIHVLIAAETAVPPPLEAAWLRELPADRQERLRAAGPDARRRSLLATRLLGAALQRAGHSPDLLATLRHPPRAKPTLAAPLHFSLAHCAGRIVCAIADDVPVGIDVESVADLGDVHAADFARYLDADERAWAGRSQRRFASVWTRKEAVVKAAGSDGLAAVPQVATAPGGSEARFAGRLWHTQALPVGRRHVAHLALADRDQPVRIERLGLAALAAL